MSRLNPFPIRHYDLALHITHTVLLPFHFPSFTRYHDSRDVWVELKIFQTAD